MANFLLVIDPDQTRRKTFIEKIKTRIAPLEGLTSSRLDVGDCSILWAINPRAPVSQFVNDRGAAIIWGEAIQGPGAKRLSAFELNGCWKDPIWRMPEPLDGFHAALSYETESHLVIGADPLGLFPLYYHVAHETLLVGSSIELFRYHPSFSRELSQDALVDILLITHPVDGTTLFRNTRRVKAGHLFFWNKGSAPRELKQYELRPSDQYFDLPHTALVNQLDESLSDAIARHVRRDSSYSILLSGGRDSRMLAGFMKRAHLKEVEALTLGFSLKDYELSCARRVARALHLKHRWVDIPQASYPQYAASHARWMHGSAGFQGMMFWGLPAHLKDLPPRVVTGHVMDSIVGGSHIPWAFDSEKRAPSFQTFFGNINRYGFPPDFIEQLLNPSLKGLVKQRIDRMQEIYNGYSRLESQKALCFDLYHRQRFFIGSIPWICSFGAWPILPAVDHRLLDRLTGMPASFLAGRHGQDALLRLKFPKLASLPLDRNSRNTRPLEPRLRHMLGDSVKQFASSLRHPLVNAHARVNPEAERRYFYRLFDINGPGWIQVREMADSHREALSFLVNPELYERALPSPKKILQYADPIVESAGVKTLLGLILLLKETIGSLEAVEVG